MKRLMMAAAALALTATAASAPAHAESYKWYATFDTWGSSTRAIDNPNGPPSDTQSWKGGFDTLEQCRTAAHMISCSGRPAEDVVGPIGLTKLKAYCRYRRSQPEPVLEMEEFWGKGFYSEITPDQLLKKKTPKQLKALRNCFRHGFPFSYHTEK